MPSYLGPPLTVLLKREQEKRLKKKRRLSDPSGQVEILHNAGHFVNAGTKEFMEAMSCICWFALGV